MLPLMNIYRYILFNSSTSFLALLAFMKHSPASSLSTICSPGFNLVLSLTTNLVNLFVFFPWTHSTLEVYMNAKKDPASSEELVKTSRRNFGIVHGICNILNFVTMGANLLFIYKMTT